MALRRSIPAASPPRPAFRGPHPVSSNPDPPSSPRVWRLLADPPSSPRLVGPVEIPALWRATVLGRSRLAVGGMGGCPGRSSPPLPSPWTMAAPASCAPLACLTGRGRLPQNHAFLRLCGDPSNIALPTRLEHASKNRRNPPFSPRAPIRPAIDRAEPDPHARSDRWPSRSPSRTPKVSPPLPRKTVLPADPAPRPSPAAPYPPPSLFGNRRNPPLLPLSALSGSGQNRARTTIEPLTL